MFTKMIETLKANPKKLVFPEGSDPRILEAASRLLAEGIMTPVLVGEPDKGRTPNIRGLDEHPSIFLYLCN